MNIKDLQQSGENLKVSKDKSTAYNTNWAREVTSRSAHGAELMFSSTSPSPCRIYLQLLLQYLGLSQ